jgi:hypothetical protein
MYTAEGSATPTCNDSIIAIAQTRGGKGYEEYRALLAGIFGREPAYGDHQWRISSRALYDYLRPLGKAVSKFVPDEILNLSRRQLEIFWDYYFLGDGNYERHPASTDGVSAATASRVLAGQLQEIIQKLGFCSSARAYKTRATPLVSSEGTIYKLRIRRSVHPECKVTGVSYGGIVGSVQVPNGIVYVRRDGHPAWCGAA